VLRSDFVHESGEPVAAGAAEKACVERLDDAARLCGRLGHDFDNILMGLLGFAELARAQVQSGTRAATYLDEMFTVAETAREVTRQLHLFNRCGRPNPFPTGLADVCDRNGLRETLGLPANVEVRTALQEDLPKVGISPDTLAAIVGQLVRNAAEAMPEGGPVVLTARPVSVSERIVDMLPAPIEPGGYVELTVADAGAGVPADFLHRIGREPFVTNKPRHRGLGLPTVLRALQAHGGGLRIESSSHGTAVVVYLPTLELLPRSSVPVDGTPAALEVASQ
jgi:signal transduction histidine kinase